MLILLILGGYSPNGFAQAVNQDLPQPRPKMRSFYRVSLFNLYNRSDLDEDDLFLFKQDLTEGLNAVNTLKLISTRQIRQLLPPGQFSIEQLTPKSAKEAFKIGKKLGTDWVIVGQVKRLSKSIFIEIQLFEQKTQSLLAEHMLWDESMSEIRRILKTVGPSLYKKALYVLKERQAQSFVPKTDLEPTNEEEKRKLTPKQKQAWALFQTSKREMDAVQKRLDETYRKTIENRKKERKILELRASKDWASLLEMKKLGIAVKKQKKRLLTFIEMYKEVPRLSLKVEEAKNRFTWLNQMIHWIPVQGGRFLIGSARSGLDERPIQWIEISPFQVSLSEITNAQYQACMDAGVCSKPHWDDRKCHIYNNKRMYYGILPARSRRGDMPVVCITWPQANTFARWVGSRLLSETEWEYIARSGDRSYLYPWGYEEPSCALAVMSDQFDVGCGYGQMLPVCSKPAGSNSSGVCDLAGNVWEWVMDRYRPSHEKVPTYGKPVLGGGNKVLRGGSFTSNMDELRATTRGELAPKRCSNYVGFRLAKPIEIDLDAP
jgi:formylglycine-generating enzyme required for sulfatase activity/TolB-like protein